MEEEHAGKVKQYKELYVRNATRDDGISLSGRLRKADRREISAFTRESPLSVLESGILSSTPCYAITRHDGTCIGIFGTRDSDHPDSGLVWLLGSDDLVRHSRTFLRFSQFFLDELHKKYRLLYNVIDARNTVHLRWLEWLGFDFVEELPRYGVEKREFILFRRYV